MSDASGNTAPVIVWFRHDLRIADNPALIAAGETRQPVIPLFVWAPEEEGDWPPGGASRWWYHHSLQSLADSLRQLGSRLVLRQGDSLAQLTALIEETGADAVFWNRRCEPAIIRRDKRIKATLKERGLTVESFNGSLLYEPWEVRNQQGKPYQVFAQFWKTAQKSAPPEAGKTPRKVKSPASWPDSVELDDFQLLPKLGWADAFADHWAPGEQGAKDKLREFIHHALENYQEDRNRPDLVGTSRMSPHLHFGEISPRQIWEAIHRGGSAVDESQKTYLNEIGWREFAHHLLYHFPQTATQPLREKFADFAWKNSPRHLRAWQRGQTGYPIVDAGMRELWATGWMHNRVRMIVASFLTKHLLIPWQRGAEWFWETLVDADLANNTLGWQWTAGCGADASPYFRIFNPVTQAERFDPQGDYIRRWVPELATLETPHIFAPWEVDEDSLRAAGVVLGKHYPCPIVNHEEARRAALDAYEIIKG